MQVAEPKTDATSEQRRLSTLKRDDNNSNNARLPWRCTNRNALCERPAYGKRRYIRACAYTQQMYRKPLGKWPDSPRFSLAHTAATVFRRFSKWSPPPPPPPPPLP
jgi:hypothetical protein